MPIILVGLPAFIITVVIEGVYFFCHVWRCLFDGSALSFSWTEPLPVAALSTVAVLLMAILAARLMRLASEDALDPFAVEPAANNNTRQANLDPFAVEQTADNNARQANLSRHPVDA